MANYLIDKINDGSNKWWLEKGVYKAQCNMCTVTEGTFIDPYEGDTFEGDVRTIYLQPYGGSSTISPSFEDIKGGLTILCSDVAGYTANSTVCSAAATKIQVGNNTSFVKELVTPAGKNISRISQYFGFGESFLISYDSNINKWVLLTDLQISGGDFLNEEFHENSIPYSFNPDAINDMINERMECCYGTCSTDASVNQKAVSGSKFRQVAGNILGVLFTTANTYATPTLKVGSFAAKPIYVGDSTPNGTTNVLKWSANTLVYFMYDGSNYRYITSVSAGSVKPSRGANTWYGTSSNGATTGAKTSTIDNFVLTQGAVAYITFSNANTYTSTKITLNINSTGAKDIYYKNAVTSSTNTLLWDAGETLCFIYSGSYYYFAGRSISLTAAEVDQIAQWEVDNRPPAVHNHGNITDGGDITGSATIASGDRLVINDESESKLNNSSITFGSSTTQFLANNGTWQTVSTEDTKVTQSAAITTAGEYPVILANSTATTAVTGSVNKTANLKYNPNTKMLTNTGAITCGSIDDGYGLNDEAILSNATMELWGEILA